MDAEWSDPDRREAALELVLLRTEGYATINRGKLERIWPDEDRREVALERILLRTAGGKPFLVDRLHRPDKGTVAYIAAKAYLRIRADETS